MKNRYGDEYHWEKLNDDEYKFVMEGKSLDYCRIGGKEGQESIDYDDLGMFDPSGGPYVAVGSKIYFDEILGGQKGDEPLIVEHLRSVDGSFIAKVK
jgi:hypothetical protein